MDKLDNLIDFLILNGDEFTANYVDLIRYELGGKIYHYGDQFKSSKEDIHVKRNIYRDYAEYYAIQFYSNYVQNKSVGERKIVSSASSMWNKHLQQAGFDVYRPPWDLRRDLKIDASKELYLMTKKIRFIFDSADFNYLISRPFLSLLDDYYVRLKEFYSNNSFEAAIVLQYNGFFEKCLLRIFQELKRPTFFWHHGGVTSFYDSRLDKRADYFIMWGDIQVKAYKEMGYDPSKFLISGHPVYNEKPQSFKFDYDQILVLTKSLLGVNPLEKSQREDRGNAITYLYSVQNILQKLGVKSAKLRPHPSENFDWYNTFIDSRFYLEDTAPFNESIKNSSVVIGPISTSIIDTMHQGVNYVIYEPIVNNLSILGWPITPPIDGKEPRIPVAHSEDELEVILREKRGIDPGIYGEFVKTPRDINFFNEIIG